MLSTKRPPCHASGIEVQPYGTPRQPEGPAQALDPRLKEKGHKGSKGTAACTPAVLSTQQFHPSMATSVGKSVELGLRPPWPVAPPRSLRRLRPLSHGLSPPRASAPSRGLRPARLLAPALARQARRSWRDKPENNLAAPSTQSLFVSGAPACRRRHASARQPGIGCRSQGRALRRHARRQRACRPSRRAMPRQPPRR